MSFPADGGILRDRNEGLGFGLTPAEFVIPKHHNGLPINPGDRLTIEFTGNTDAAGVIRSPRLRDARIISASDLSPRERDVLGQGILKPTYVVLSSIEPREFKRMYLGDFREEYPETPDVLRCDKCDEPTEDLSPDGLCEACNAAKEPTPVEYNEPTRPTTGIQARNGDRFSIRECDTESGCLIVTRFCEPRPVERVHIPAEVAREIAYSLLREVDPRAEKK